MEAPRFAELVRWLIAERFDDASPPSQFQPDVMHERFPAWSFRVEPVLAVAAVSLERNELRLTAGLAIEVPYTPEVSHYINRLNNKDLVFGRAFLVGNDETGSGAVLMQEIVFGEALSWEHPPSVQYTLQQIVTLCGQAARLAQGVLSQFAARRFDNSEAFFLRMNG